MLTQAHTSGTIAALNKYNLEKTALPKPLKTMGRWAKKKLLRGAKFTGNVAVGEAPVKTLKGIVTGKAFRRGGPLHWREAFWPTINPRASSGKKMLQWLHRLSILAPAYSTVQAMRGRGDPSESKLTNILSPIGETVGAAYTIPFGAAGMLLGPAAGKHLGTSIGRAFSRVPPKVPPQYPLPPADYPNLVYANKGPQNDATRTNIPIRPF